MLQFYALEGFLARLVQSPHADNLVLKGGALLPAFVPRRPTRDVDFATTALANDLETGRAAVLSVLAVELDDGLEFESSRTKAETIREDELYSGLRVTVHGRLARATVQFHVDINVGDPIWPAVAQVSVPRLLGGDDLILTGYSIAMVLAEKLVTAIQRGRANTRWRDFVDIASLSRHHDIDGGELRGAIEGVAAHRQADLEPLRALLEGFGDLAQQKWSAWRRKQKLARATPARFADLVEEVLAFGERPLSEADLEATWDSRTRRWS